MARKKTIEDLHEAARRKGGECLSTEYVNIKHKYRWRCASNHEWEFSAEVALAGHWCSECYHLGRILDPNRACQKCGEVNWMKRSGRVGAGDCRTCHARGNRNWYYATHDVRLVDAAEYREANREKFNACCAASHAKKPAEKRANDRAHYHRNRKRLLAYGSWYRSTHREQCRAIVRSLHAKNNYGGKRRARLLGSLGGHHTDAEWRACKKKFSYRCCDCGLKQGQPYPESAGPAWVGKVMVLTKGHRVPLTPCRENDWHAGSDAIFNIYPQCMLDNLRQHSTIHESVVSFSLFDRHVPEVELIARRR